MSDERPAAPVHSYREDIATDQLIGRVLQVGVALAAAVMLIGWILFLARHGHEPADVQEFRLLPTSVFGVIRGVASMRADAVMQLGIVLLLATPVARVALTVVAFLHRRDGIFVFLSGVVLLILLYGMFWSGIPS